jgi:hypothetical protein
VLENWAAPPDLDDRTVAHESDEIGGLVVTISIDILSFANNHPLDLADKRRVEHRGPLPTTSPKVRSQNAGNGPG